MSNLQITLSIVGVLLIAAIIGHGIWTMRRNSQQMTRPSRRHPVKKKTTGQQQDNGVDNRSEEHFDDDGVGEVRVVKKSENPIEQMSMNLDIDDDDTPLPSMRVDTEEADTAGQGEFRLQPDDVSETDSEASVDISDSQSDRTDNNVNQPVTAEDSPIRTKPEAKTQNKRASEENVDAVATKQQQKQPSGMKKPQPAQEVISLFVKGSVQGAVLLQMMTELGCKFGEMGIFHRYEQTSGNGPLIFSVANMFNPGTFDLDNIENFETDGVALFMSLPLDYDGQQAFNMMLNAAKKLAMEIPQGQVLDGKRQVLSRQSIQQAHHTIREFEKAQANA